MRTELTAVDLFCGAGGFSLGFGRAHFRVLAAFDSSEAAVRTYCHNLGGHAAVQDLTLPTAVPDALVVLGGPPCQGFSSAGLRRAGDGRNSLVGRFAEIVSALRPPAFVFENVEGFLTSEDGAYVLDLLTPLIAAGYRIHLRKINAANYGVPQHRKRVIAIGGLGWEPSVPEFTHTAYGAPGALAAARHLPLAPSASGALAGLPAAGVAPASHASAISDHLYTPLEGADLERARALRAGQTMRDLPEVMWHQSYRRRAFRRVQDGTPTERRGGAPAGVRRLAANQPSKAITGGARNEFLHPSEDRFLTLRECARLQTFPDSFQFFGSPAERAQLIGNAVPPLLAEQIALTLAADLRSRQSPVSPSTAGGLISFVPTEANGMSPALERISRRVLSTFPLLSSSRGQLQLWG